MFSEKAKVWSCVDRDEFGDQVEDYIWRRDCHRRETDLTNTSSDRVDESAHGFSNFIVQALRRSACGEEDSRE